MSEFTHKQQQKKEQILSFCLKILKGEKPAEVVKQNMWIIDNVHYRDIIWVTDALQRQNIPMQEIKTGVNKFLNLFYKTLNKAKTELPSEYSFLYFLVENNREMDYRLKNIRPLLRKFNNNNNEDITIHKNLKNAFAELQIFSRQYVIIENILFPVLENMWDDYRCVQIMWSFHDDIRRNLKAIVNELEKENPDIKYVNRFSGDIFFNMYAIKFREEKILFPRILETIPKKILEKMLFESAELPWPFKAPKKRLLKEKSFFQQTPADNRLVDLQTGSLFPEQIRWMMNHLPVDVTYVDENNKVRYFSAPKKRIFPRTIAVIERDVRNCHPHESVHVVEKIIESFRNGKKDYADFWINIKDELVYIRYFAIRDETGKYRGVLEVSQEVSGIQHLKGEQRLLDWDD